MLLFKLCPGFGFARKVVMHVETMSQGRSDYWLKINSLRFKINGPFTAGFVQPRQLRSYCALTPAKFGKVQFVWGGVNVQKNSAAPKKCGSPSTSREPHVRCLAEHNFSRRLCTKWPYMSQHMSEVSCSLCALLLPSVSLDALPLQAARGTVIQSVSVQYL